MPELTIEQTRLLSALREAKARRQTTKARVEAENAQRLADAIRTDEDAVNRLVRETFEAGVSKRRIGREGLGTTDPFTVNRILEKTASEVAIAKAVEAVTSKPIRELSKAHAAERGFVDPDADLFVLVDYPHFPTRWPAKGDPYPDPLVGVLKRVFGLWYVLEDPSGMLEWEMTEWEANDGVLPRLLEAYTDQANR